jgi:hypothetical protein
MTPSEWSLLEEGHVAREQSRNRAIAHWLSPLLSATAGQVITAAQLLGEDEEAAPANDSPRALREAERKLKKTLQAIAKRNKREHAKKEKSCQA